MSSYSKLVSAEFSGIMVGAIGNLAGICVAACRGRRCSDASVAIVHL